MSVSLCAGVKVPQAKSAPHGMRTQAQPARAQAYKTATNGAKPAPSSQEEAWSKNTILSEYGSAARPDLSPIPVQSFPASLHESGPSRAIPLDLSGDLGLPYPASAPNMLASFVRICAGETLETHISATSNAYYVIRGSGSTTSEHGTVHWQQGDTLVLPSCHKPIRHSADSHSTEHGGAALYWVHDGPLLAYLGVEPHGTRFPPAFYSKECLVHAVEEVRARPGAEERNRIGVLLGNTATQETKTLTHVLWALFNVLPANHTQAPHKHSATALDLAVYAGTNVFTMMGPDIDSEGQIVDPLRVDWSTGGMFTTPPGWWHSHHNEGNEDAWVMPIQDAGLFTHQRVLDIRFAPVEKDRLKHNVIHGATFEGENIKIPHKRRTHSSGTVKH